MATTSTIFRPMPYLPNLYTMPIGPSLLIPVSSGATARHARQKPSSQEPYSGALVQWATLLQLHPQPSSPSSLGDTKLLEFSHVLSYFWDRNKGWSLERKTHLSQSVRLITKHHRLGGLNSRNSFLTVWRLEVQDQGASVVGFCWGLSSWLADGCLLAVSSQGEQREISLPLLITTLIPSWGSHPHDLIQLDLPKVPSPNSIAFKVKTSTCKFWGDTNIQFLTIK